MLKDAHGSQRAYGIYRGVVTDNRDPQNNGRLKVKVPQLFANEPTEWAWPSVSAASRNQPPAVGQGVWVMFEGGDVAFPIWTGVFGKNAGTGKDVLIKQLSGAEGLYGISDYIILVRTPNGSVEVDLVATLLAMANTLKNQQLQLTSLADRVSALEG